MTPAMEHTAAFKYAVAFIRYYRERVRADGVAMANRRLATYRRAALQACSNRMSWQSKLKRLRKPASLDRARGAIECWRAVEAYFSERIRNMGESF